MQIDLLIDPPADGAWNMAADETLLEATAVDGQPRLRFYRWRTATQSLGYFQHSQQRSEHPSSEELPWVRRGTGGGALIHDFDLTYSLTVPETSRGDSRNWYDAAHLALLELLRRRGVTAALAREETAETPPFLCFQRRAEGDVVLHGEKIAGSAQRRRRGGLLQHGSLLLARSQHAPELPGLLELTGKPWPVEELAREWAEHLADRLQGRLRPAEWTPDLLQAARQGPLSRHVSSAWKLRR